MILPFPLIKGVRNSREKNHLKKQLPVWRAHLLSIDADGGDSLVFDLKTNNTHAPFSRKGGLLNAFLVERSKFELYIRYVTFESISVICIHLKLHHLFASVFFLSFS